VNFLLDTNACIALINGNPLEVRQRFAQAIESGDRMVTSSIVTFELWYGVAKSARQKVNEERLATFLAGPIEVIDFDNGDARAAGRVRAALETIGQPIGAYDLLIAGQALERGFTLVTANTGEFSRVSGLGWEDWAHT
jgi:tRNA(fMet)-specific endonuclease VapC